MPSRMKVFIAKILCVVIFADKVDAPPVSTKDPPSSSVDTTPAEPIRKEVKQQEEPPSAVSGPAPTSIPPIPPVPSEGNQLELLLHCIL